MIFLDFLRIFYKNEIVTYFNYYTFNTINVFYFQQQYT